MECDCYSNCSTHCKAVATEEGITQHYVCDDCGIILLGENKYNEYCAKCEEIGLGPVS